MKGRSRGFTLVELCTVLVIIGLLIRVALPNYRNMVRNARAAQVVGDMIAIRAAVFAYYAETGTWPVESATGAIPANLARHLPPKFTFTRPKYRLDWENWVLPNGLPRYPTHKTMLGVSAEITDAKLGNTVLKLISRTSPRLTFANRYTMVIVATGEGL